MKHITLYESFLNEEENLDAVLRAALIDHYKNSDDTDKYGQMPISSLTVTNIIKDKDLAAKVTAFVEAGKSKIAKLQTYGGRFGQYKALTIKDDSVLQGELTAALRSNKNRNDRMNQW